MAEAEMARVAEDAAARWAVQGITIIHRYGVIAPGETIVLVVTASAHRGLMDYLKTRAPFWKREHLADDRTGDWVEAAAGDDAAAERWRVTAQGRERG
jgi:molybdopterin synthase catalytic subunit